jgi:polyhydroxybutyrate depolymerase
MAATSISRRRKPIRAFQMLAFLFILMVPGWWWAYAWAAQLAAKLIQPAENTQGKTLEVDHRQRTYYLHVPANLPADKPVPLVLVFHGGGGTALGMERYLTHFSQLADHEGFLVAYPEGVDKNWNDGRDNPASTPARENVDDLAFALALLDDICNQHNVDARRIYSTGISNGAIFSHYLAANHAEKIAAIAPVVGGIADPFYQKFHPSQPVSVLILQGTQDPLVPYGGGKIAIGNQDRGQVIATDQTVKLWVERDACQTQPVEDDLPDTDPNDGCTIKRFTYGHGQAGTEVVLYKIEGGGHTWPGGPQYFPKALIGRVCRDIDATQVIWDFFKAHPKLDP